MAITEYLNSHHVFNIADFKEAFPDSVTDRNLLARAVKNGKVERVRQGLYVSRTDRFFDAEPDTVSIAQKSVNDAVFCYLSALKLHGVLHNITFYTQFYTSHQLLPFAYGGITYKPLSSGRRQIETERLFAPNQTNPEVTTREQTVIDCLSRPTLAGGPENLLRSLGGYLYLDAESAARISTAAGASTRARLGWLLQNMQQSWQVPKKMLKLLREGIGEGPYYFYKSKARERYWSPAWKLYLPNPEQEMLSWLRA
jgi:predicted transcriptional regulator of viral defense system